MVPPPDPPSPPKVVRGKRAAILLACGKCLKRVDDPKATRRALKEAAARRLAAAPGGAGKVRLVRTACLGLCPKRALVTASAATLARGEYVLVRGPEEAEGAVGRLLP